MPIISGRVFEDASRSGTYAPGDVLRGGVDVDITSSGTPVVTVTTAADGTFTATLPSGTYRVGVTPPPGWAALCPTGTLFFDVALVGADATGLDFPLVTVRLQVDWVRVWDRRPVS